MTEDSNGPDDLPERDLPQTPAGWSSWPREERVRYLAIMLTRAELLAHIRGVIGSERSSERLDKRELAEIAETLGAAP